MTEVEIEVVANEIAKVGGTSFSAGEHGAVTHAVTGRTRSGLGPRLLPPIA
jgi:hypothetical protein